MDNLVLSTLGHTWILDIDGTLVIHNGYKIDGKDTFLPGVEEFLKAIPEQDMVILITSRTEEYRRITEQFFQEHGIRYDYILFGVPYGERILINDNKPSGLQTGIAVNVSRDQPFVMSFQLDSNL